MSSKTHKAGFVSIIGSPNVGKSTLVNALMGEKLAIATSKAQTTRHRIMGMLNGTDFQIVFSDTPGILKPHYGLHENMMKFVEGSFIDADIILYVVEGKEKEIKLPQIEEKLKQTQSKVLLVINKADLLKEEEIEPIRDYWQEKLPNAEVRFISALHHVHTLKLLDRIKELLPESPPFFDKENFTDKSSRFFASEMIRKQLFLQLKQEIPYACEVVVTSFKDTEKIIKVAATIFTEKESQKAIIIGNKGSQIKAIGTDARKEMESFFEHKIFLDLSVKVLKNWRNNEGLLKKFGYDS